MTQEQEKRYQLSFTGPMIGEQHIGTIDELRKIWRERKDAEIVTKEQGRLSTDIIEKKRKYTYWDITDLQTHEIVWEGKNNQ